MMEKPFIVIRCRKCGELLLANDEKAKTKKCHKCNRVNRLDRVVIECRLRSLERAQNALRYLKIPPSERDDVPYLLYSTIDHVKTQVDSIGIFFWKIKYKHGEGIEIEDILEMAVEEGLDVDEVKKAIQKKISDGEILIKKNKLLKVMN